MFSRSNKENKKFITMGQNKINIDDYSEYFKDDENSNAKVLEKLKHRIDAINEHFDVENFNPRKILEYKVVHEYSSHPSYHYPTDSGFDLYSIEPVEIPSLGRALVRTGLSFNLPDGTELQVRSKSGLALDKGIMVLNSPGTVDCGYTGEVKVILFNCSDKPVLIERGMKIAQAVYCHAMNGKWVDIQEVDTIQKKDRNENGFGSTGI